MNKNDRRLSRLDKIAKYIYPRHNFKDHILLTVKIAKFLATKLKADLVTVEAAAYLHDVGRVILRYKHHSYTGKIIGDFILFLLGFDKKERDRITYCILVHDCTKGKPTTLEAEIVSNADALSQIDNFLYLFSVYYSSHGQNTLETKKWIKEKYAKSTNKKITLPIAKKMAKEKLKITNDVLKWPNITNVRKFS